MLSVKNRQRGSLLLMIITILLIGAACQQPIERTYRSPAPPAVTLAAPTLIVATRQPRAIASATLPATAPTAALTTVRPSSSPVSAAAMPVPEAHPVTIGYSVEGRPIVARRFGMGERILLIVGGIHGGWEANTVALVEALSEHFTAHPDAILPGISIVVIPVANPDGLARGTTQAGRFNANGVDLNRNWGCGWSAEARWRAQQVDPGVRAFSEPETQALAAFIRALQPAAALFYHSAADGIFAGTCPSAVRAGDSAALAAVLGEAAGYSYGEAFTAYPVTGTAASWAHGQGIAAADVELSSRSDPEFERNLRGLLAVQRWLLAGG
ncbi:MAG: M14 family metallopeptidase [Aggregatilineales bacterium]